MMKTEELKKLLEKYYEGKTSEAEELTLKKFINEKNIPAEFEVEQKIFSYYSGLRKIPEPSSDFEERILTAVDKNRKDLRSFKNRELSISLLSTAAAVLILIGSYFFFIHRTEPRDTFSDPELAYAETLKILYNVSSRLNQGTQTLKPLGKIHEVNSKSFEAINKSTIIIEENMKSLLYIQKAMDIVNLPSGHNKN